jgi:hypothetical protein
LTADDIVKIIGAVSVATVAILGAVGAIYAQIRRIHQMVNGRMNELLELTRSSSRTAGQQDILNPQAGTEPPSVAPPSAAEQLT